MPCNQCGIMQKKLKEIKSIYLVPEVIVFHFNNNVILENYIDIIENKEGNIKKYELKSIIFSKKIKKNEINYEIAVKNNNERWIYYTNNGANVLSLNEIIKKEGICTALYK